MTHEDEGNYRGKHDRAVLDKNIAEKINEKTTDNRISCAAAHKIAKDIDIRPHEVGVAIDLMEVKLTKCQLGLFGVDKNAVLPPVDREKNLEILKAIEKELVMGRLPCEAAWRIAAEAGVGKRTVAEICNKMKVKLSKCQLGTF